MTAPEPVGTIPERRRRERLVALALLGLLALNYPLVALFNHTTLVLGIPLLYLYLFVAWLVVIVLVARAISQIEVGTGDKSE